MPDQRSKGQRPKKLPNGMSSNLSGSSSSFSWPLMQMRHPAPPKSRPQIIAVSNWFLVLVRRITLSMRPKSLGSISEVRVGQARTISCAGTSTMRRGIHPPS